MGWTRIALAAVRVVGWCSLALIVLFVYLAEGIGSNDGTWYLQVVNRVANGEVLYRDVFLGTTPLAFYLTSAATSILGVEMLTLRLVLTLSFVATIYLCVATARELGTGRGFRFLILPALVVYALPYQGSTYSPLATVFFLACYLGILRWRRLDATAGGGRAAALALAGAGFAAGLAFATKQNVGVYALGAALLALALHRRSRAVNRQTSRGWREPALYLVPGASFLIATVVVLLPVWASGGGAGLIEYGFLNKGSYVVHGQQSYLDGLKTMVWYAYRSTVSPNLEGFNDMVPFALAPAAFAALGVAWPRATPVERGKITIAVVFSTAAFATAFPRADSPHMSYVMPALLVSIAFAGHLVMPRIPGYLSRVIGIALALWLLAGVGAMLAQPWRVLTSGEYRLSTLPHFCGVPVSIVEEDKVRAGAAALVRAADGDDVLILASSAGLHYLTTGLRNVSATDYPLVTTFGRDGEARLIEAIAQGNIRKVCVEEPGELGSLRPVHLDRYVHQNLVRGEELGPCTMYYRPR